MEPACIEGPEVPIYKQGCLHITSYFLQDGTTVQRLRNSGCNLKVIKTHISSIVTNLHYFQSSNMTKPGTCQTFFMLQEGLLLEAPHHVV